MCFKKLNFTYQSYDFKSENIQSKYFERLLKTIDSEFFEKTERHFMYFFCDVKLSKKNSIQNDFKFEENYYRNFYLHLKGFNPTIFGSSSFNVHSKINFDEFAYKVD